MFLPSDTLPPVVILAGGLATRMRPQTQTIPKALLPVAGRPFLAHQLELLHDQGVRRVVLCVGYLGEQIESTFGNGSASGVDIAYSYDGPNLLGTAGAIHKALPLLGSDFFVLYGDSYLDIDFAELWKSYKGQPKPALMTVISALLASEPANAWLANGIIRAYDKREPRPEMEHVDYGLNLFNASLFQADISDLSQLQTALATDGRMAGYEVENPYFEIGSRAGLAALESHLSTRTK